MRRTVVDTIVQTSGDCCRESGLQIKSSVCVADLQGQERARTSTSR